MAAPTDASEVQRKAEGLNPLSLRGAQTAPLDAIKGSLIRCGGDGPMSTRKGQAASVTLLRREQLRSASAPTTLLEDPRDCHTSVRTGSQ